MLTNCSFFLEQISNLPRVFHRFSSKFKIVKEYKKRPEFVNPVNVCMGRTTDEFRDTAAEYVPIDETIKRLLHNKDIAQTLPSLIPPPASDGTYHTFLDGSRFRESPFLRLQRDEPKLSIQL